MTDVLAPRERASTVASGGRSLWWLTPIGSVALVVPVTLYLAVHIPDADYRLFYKAPRVITGDQALLFLAAAGALVLGTMLPLVASSAVPAPPRRLSAQAADVLRRSEPVVFGLTVLGYALLGGLGVARGATPGVLLSAIVSQSNYTGRLKDLFAPVAGVTSLTQVGIAYVVVAATLLCAERAGSVRSARLIRRLALVLVLGLLRSYLLTERLALLELLVPLVAIGAVTLRRRLRTGWWLNWVPAIGVPALVVVFGAFEYSRSWVFYRVHGTQTFPAFVVERLAGYYATAYNNGALQLAHDPAVGRLPYDSVQAFWTAPGIAQLNLYERLTGQQGGDLLANVLAQYGNPEFNNPGGLAVPIIDWGPVGGLLFFLVAGVVVGIAFRSWRAGHPIGRLIYPVLFTGLLELPRYLYWTQGRVFPALVTLGVIGALMTRAERTIVRGRAASPVPVGGRA